MARGWESKSVEAQQEMAEQKRAPRTVPTPEEIERRARRNALELQRTRILSELQSACQPRFRDQLEAALAHLDSELQKLA